MFWKTEAQAKAQNCELLPAQYRSTYSLHVNIKFICHVEEILHINVILATDTSKTVKLYKLRGLT